MTELDHTDLLPIDPKVDPAFKAVVREKPILLALLNDLFAFLELPSAIDLEYRDTELDGIGFDGKTGRLDVVVKLDQDRLINVEMQIRNHFDIVERLQFYGSKLFVNQFKRGMAHSTDQILSTFVIGILAFSLNEHTEISDQEMVHYFRFADLKLGCELPGSKVSILTIELPKLEAFLAKHGNTRLAYWSRFFRHEKPDLPAITEYVMTAKAEDILKKKQQDDDFMKSYKEARAILDDQESMLKTYAYNAALQARREGIREGIKEGMAEGKLAERKTIVQRLHQSGMPPAAIAALLAISEDEITALIS